MRKDHEILVLGEAFTSINQALGDNNLSDVRRDELTTQWFECIDSLVAIDSKSRAGMRVKGGVIIVFAARLDAVPKNLTLSLVGDILGVAR
jgi:hypothetical protein